LLPIYQNFIAHLAKQYTCIRSILDLNLFVALKCIIFFQAKIAIGFKGLSTAKIISSIQRVLVQESSSLKI